MKSSELRAITNSVVNNKKINIDKYLIDINKKLLKAAKAVLHRENV